MALIDYCLSLRVLIILDYSNRFFNTWEPGYESISVDGVKEGVINATYLETTSAVTVSNGK